MNLLREATSPLFLLVGDRELRSPRQHVKEPAAAGVDRLSPAVVQDAGVSTTRLLQHCWIRECGSRRLR